MLRNHLLKSPSGMSSRNIFLKHFITSCPESDDLSNLPTSSSPRSYNSQRLLLVDGFLHSISRIRRYHINPYSLCHPLKSLPSKYKICLCQYLLIYLCILYLFHIVLFFVLLIFLSSYFFIDFIMFFTVLFSIVFVFTHVFVLFYVVLLFYHNTTLYLLPTITVNKEKLFDWLNIPTFPFSLFYRFTSHFPEKLQTTEHNLRTVESVY